MRQWFFARQGQTKGPYTDGQLRALARSGQLLPDDLLSYSGAGKWIPAREVPNLFPGAAPSPPLPPPSAPPSEEASRSVLEPLLALPKPLLFAIFGGIGGLLGALLLGEALWAFLSPASFRPPEPQVRLGIPSAVRVYLGGKNRFVVNLSREGFQGPVRIEAENPPEGVRFSPVSIPEDKDKAEVEVQAAADLPPGAYSLTVHGRASDGGGVRDHIGAIELTVEPIPARLLLSVPTEVTAYQGGKAQFRIKLARHHFTGPVKLRFQGLPDSISLPDTIEDGDRSEVAFTVRAPESSKLGEWPITLIGTKQDGEGKIRAIARFNLRVRAVPVPQADIVFVLDLTGSMQFAIDGIKLGIQTFATELEKGRIDARIGLIGFRDLEVDKEPLNPLFVMTIDDKPFTKDYEAFKAEVGKLRANGGGDVPESSLQALALAAKQPFRSNASSVLLLITDAPPKIHRSEKPSTLQETIDDLESKRISQLHLVVRPSDYRQDYKKFHPALTGKFFDLSRSTTADAFRDVLPRLSREISTTIAAKPRTLEDVPALPELPVEAHVPPPPPVEVAVVKAVQSTQAYTHRDRYRLLLAIAVWTMSMAGCISLLILAGQRFYACRRFAGFAEGSKSLGGGFLAGLVGGAAGQLLFQSTAGGTAWDVVSRLLGWGLLGGLIGSGMSFFVPNLKWWRGLLGGVVGGLLGAAAFVVISLAVGAFLGRWIGAGILGFFIGLMVALAELAFRRYWLEVAFSPREIRTVTLGSAKVGLGGDERRAAVAVPGSPPIVLRYWIDGDRVMCEDVIKERTAEVVPGDRKSLGKVTITLCSAAHGRKTGCTLQLSNGASFHLVEGLPLTEEDLPGLQAQGADGVVAVVSRRPNDPAILLLRNRSKETWVLRVRGGGEQMIAPGGGLELSSNGSISFGQLQGALRRESL